MLAAAFLVLGLHAEAHRSHRQHHLNAERMLGGAPDAAHFAAKMHDALATANIGTFMEQVHAMKKLELKFHSSALVKKALHCEVDELPGGTLSTDKNGIRQMGKDLKEMKNMQEYGERVFGKEAYASLNFIFMRPMQFAVNMLKSAPLLLPQAFYNVLYAQGLVPSPPLNENQKALIKDLGGDEEAELTGYFGHDA